MRTATHRVSAEIMLWVCEHCPVAASTITSENEYDFTLFQSVPQYYIRFEIEEEYSWFSLRWL